MSAAVEDRIVAMKIENTQFEKGVAQSLSSLQKLETVLNKGISTKGLDNVSNNLRGFNLNPMESALSGISKSWLAMSTIAITALAQISSTVFSTGANMIKSLSLDPVLQGFNEYSTNLNSIQTVLANTQAQGTTLDDVNGALQQLNNYSDKTIYNFGEMAKNIGTFTAAGVDLQGSVDSIKGIANLAALSGSSSEQASTAMYQLSQAIAAGRVSLQDWNSVVNAGMGGSTFQRALAQTATAMGTIDKSAVSIDESTGKMTINGASFRDSISAIGGEKWLTSDVLTNTLSQFTGDLTDAQLAAQGFNKEQIKAIQLTATTAQDAATKVKTIKQVFDVAKETIGSGWSLTFMRIFGDFEQARTTFTQLSNFLGGIIKANAKARNKVLKDWGDLGGRTKIISAVTNAWKALMSVLGPIRDAFREVFPAKTGEQLFQLSKGLNQFMRALRLTKDAQENLKNTFAGFFAVLHIGFTIVSGILHVLGSLLGLFVRGQGSTLEFTGSIGEMLVALDKFLTKGQYVANFFDLIANALVAVLGPLLEVRNGLIDAFVGLITADPTRVFNGISDAIQSLLGLVDSLSASFANVVNTISDAMGGLGHISGFSLSSMFSGADTGGATAGIQGIKDGLDGIEAPSLRIKLLWDKIAKIFGQVGDFLKPLTDQFKTAGSALTSAFSDFFSGASKELDFSEFLAAINTGLFLAIFLQFRKFRQALTGIADSASGVLNQVTSNLKSMQADVRANVIIKIAVALLLLSGAIYLLAQTNPQSLGLALAAVTAMLLELVVAMKSLEKAVGSMKDGAKLAIIAGGMLLMSIAIAALAGAVYLFSLMSLKDMQKGMLGVLEAITLLTAASVLLSKGGAGANMIGAAAGLLIMSLALVALAGAVELYARIDPEVLTNGLVKIAASIAVLALAMNLMETSVGGAVAMAIVAGGLVILAGALKKFGDMSGGEIAKSMIVLALSMAILSAGMEGLEAGIGGAAALIVMVLALKMLVPVLQALGDMDTSTIVKGLLALIGVMVALSLTALALSVAVPALLGLGAALALIGGAVFLAGTGVLAFATALAILTRSGTEGFAVFKQIVMDFVEWLPEVISAFGDVISSIAQLIGEKAPELNAAFAELLSGLIDSAIKLTPKIGKLFSKLIETGLKVIVSYYSDLAEAGLQLIQNLLEAITKKVPDIADAAGDLIAAFIKAIGKQAVKLANAAADALVDFLNGLADAITTHSTQINNAGARVAVAFVAGVTQPLRNAGQQILDAIQGALNWAKDHVKLPHFSVGDIVGSHRDSVSAAQRMVNQLGLVGGVDAVKSAFDTIGGQIDSEIEKAKGKIKDAKSKLEQLKKKGRGDSKEADKVRKEIDDQQKALHELNKEHDNWKKKQKENRATLIEDAKAWDANAKAIDDATQKLKEATDARDAFQAGVVSTFGGKPDISKGQSLASYMRQVAAKTKETEKFMATLQALRAAGLSDESYRQLLAEGTDAQHLMDQLLTGGTSAVTAFNQANTAMVGAANTLASTASQTLFYDAAVTQAQGVLKGWEDSQAGLEAEMNVIALAMVKAFKKALKMKSPSRVMAEQGEYSAEGVAVGLKAGIRSVEKASEQVANASVDALKATMNKATASVNVMDLTPSVTPVLDLSQLQKDATAIGTMLATEPIVASVSYSQASDIAAARLAANEAQAAQAEANASSDVTYNQYNTSPKALDSATVYRQTKSLFALKKEELGV